MALNENEIGLLVDFLVGQVVVEEQFTLGENRGFRRVDVLGGLLFTPFRSEGKLAGGETANPADFLTDGYHQPSAEAGDEFPTLKVLVEKARLFQNLGGNLLGLEKLGEGKTVDRRVADLEFLGRVGSEPSLLGPVFERDGAFLTLIK